MTTTPQATSSTHDRATQYARDVVAGAVLAGPHVRDAARRHLRDLETGHRRGLEYNAEAAGRAIGFFEQVLRFPDGERAGMAFVLEPWQCFVVGSLFGWLRSEDGLRRFRTCYLETGKGPLALDTPIPTPSGWTTMGEIAVGDLVFDERGEPCRVVGVSEVFHDRPCFRVRFSDGCEIVADSVHEWRTAALRTGGKPGPKPADMPRKGGYATRSTAEIARTLTTGATTSLHPQAKWNHRIDVCGPLELPQADLPIEPYTLGCWLGDGDSDCARVTVGDADVEILEHLAEAGTHIGLRKGDKPRAGRYRLGGNVGRGMWGGASLNAALRVENLLKNKHIPAAYLRASVPQRMALLQGLMDTDGSALKTGESELTLCDPVLARDAVELIRSLGYKPGVQQSDAKINGVAVGQRWRIRFHAFAERPVFRLARKATRLKPRPPTRPLSLGRMIVGCDPVDSVPVRCITVDSPSHLFLAGEGMIPTHNSGKSPLGAGIGLYLLTADKQRGAECYVAAVTRDQAGIAFRDAVRMVEASPALTSRIQLSGTRSVFNLAVKATGSYFRPISSEGRALDGKRVHFALLDEIHEHPSAAVVDKIVAGIKALRQPLICEITNSGYDRSSVCWSHHQYSTKVAAGAVEDDEWFAYVCALDPEDKPLEDESCWLKSNPSLGVTIRHDYLRKQVREARGMPAKESIVLRLNFCVWTDAANPWIDGNLWRQCETHFDLSEVEGLPCWGGLDLSGKNDLTALGLVWRLEEGRYRAAVWYWTPGDTLDERGRRDGVPYEHWANEGLVEAPPGRAINLNYVARKLGELAGRFDVQNIAFDPYHIEYLRQACDEEGVELPLVPHGQGYAKTAKSNLYMPRSIELLEQAVFAGSVEVLPNPVLSWNSASAVLEADAKGNRIFQKRKSTGRIDGLVALAMAMGAANEDDDGAALDDWLKHVTEAA